MITAAESPARGHRGPHSAMLRQTGRDKGRGSAPVLGLGRGTGARSALDLDETGAQAEIVGKGTDLLASNPGDARTAGELLDLGCEFAEFPGNGVGHGVSSSILDILSEGGSLGRLAMVHAQLGLFASSFSWRGSLLRLRAAAQPRASGSS